MSVFASARSSARNSCLAILTLAVAVFAATFCLTGTAVCGQGIVTGTVAGTVQDPQGGIVANATIEAVETATGAKFTGHSNAQGYFELNNLPPGSYSLSIESSGFRKLQMGDVIVVAGRTNTLAGLTLQVGSASETVTVEAATPLIESSSS